MSEESEQHLWDKIAELESQVKKLTSERDCWMENAKNWNKALAGLDVKFRNKALAHDLDRSRFAAALRKMRGLNSALDSLKIEYESLRRIS